LLAYDGSPKAREALYIATYLASHWDTHLTIVTVAEPNRTTSQTLSSALDYLESHQVRADFVKRSGKVHQVILDTAREQASDLIIMGSYGFSPVLEMMLGSTVDHLLRKSQCPVLICR